jgi:hypothetical protein
MVTKKIKYKVGDILIFRVNALQYLKHGRPSLLTFALREWIKRSEDVQNEFDHLRNLLNVRHAALDEKGYLITDGVNYKYTPEARAKINEELYQHKNKTVHIEPFYTSGFPADIDPYWFNAFYGIVIEPTQDGAKFVELYGQKEQKQEEIAQPTE